MDVDVDVRSATILSSEEPKKTQFSSVFLASLEKAGNEKQNPPTARNGPTWLAEAGGCEGYGHLGSTFFDT